MAQEEMKHVLDGYKVLDFTQVLAGPTVTRLMAEMGAEIIKGDEMLVAQGLVQFELFTGKEASKEDFLRSLQSARTETS